MTTQSTPPGGGRSVGELVSEVSELTSRLVRAEIDLAKAEIQGRAQQLGLGAGLVAAAGLLSLYLLAAVIATAILALCTVWAPWLAALVVTGVLLLIIVVLALVGVNRLKKGSPPKPTRALENVQQDIDAVKAGITS
ncbi:membrane protein [Cellulomonas chitinilytica]|uniref:Membrane protein n=1 Tax=Cellulomonas chitinilytica TaxID=398759 RepID=A0A919P3H1_9CELL|nr:phage holin family protein [Cellulomonas chitinilytica]GIG21570.1 membrane protein [Cellulomonas chitinilytica]